MVSQSINTNNPAAPKTEKGRSRHATLAQCKKLAGPGNASAVVLQKLCHYCSRAKFCMDGEHWTAPTTDMLMRELGLSKSTIQKAIRDLNAACVIEVRHRHFNRSPRRYIRLIDDPAKLEDDRNYRGSDDPCRPNQNMTPSDEHSMHNKKKKKKKSQSKNKPIQEEARHFEDQEVLSASARHSQDGFSTTPNSQATASIETSPNSAGYQVWQPQNCLENLWRKKVRSDAQSHATRFSNLLSARRGWDSKMREAWAKRFTLRYQREAYRAIVAGRCGPGNGNATNTNIWET